MARKNKKSATGASDAPNSKIDALASFDEQALSALTAKIEKGFGKSKSKPEGQPEAPASGRSHKQEKLSLKSKDRDGKGKPKAKAPELVRGTKRDANGKAKAAVKPTSNSQNGRKEARGESDKDDRATLLQEILALGGTEEDLDLVADAVSDEDDEGPSTSSLPDKSFRKDLASFVAGLGIEGGVQEDEDSAAEEEVEDGWEEASGSNSSGAASESEGSEDSEEIAEVPAKKPKLTSPVEAQLSSNPNRLVSIVPCVSHWSD